jgi:signal transduction histidine kinase
MEKETKRVFQKMLEILQEQQDSIRELQRKAKPSAQNIDDGLARRIERIALEVGERASYEIDWPRLCDRHYAARN